MSTSVRISDLSVLPSIRMVDFIPVVQSGSTSALTTYRTPISVLNDFNAASGSTLSAFFASQSLSASHAILSDSASYLYPTILYRATVTASVSSSWAARALTSSYASSSTIAFSSSYSRLSDSASYLYPTFVYNATVSSSVSASWCVTSSWAQNGLKTGSNYPVTVSYAGTASVSLNQQVPVGAVVAWTPTVLGVTPAPDGWLYANGSTFSNITYPTLASLVGNNYGLPFTTSVQIKAESTNAYHSANDGTLKVIFGNGGSGIYSLTFQAVTYFVASGSFKAFTALDSGDYASTVTDIGVNPAVAYPQTYTIPYGPTGTRTTSSITYGTPQFRVPNFMQSYYAINPYPLINPIAYIIKT